MRKASTLWMKAVAGMCGLVLGAGGGCLPDNLFVDTAGEIVESLIISGATRALSGAGLQI